MNLLVAEDDTTMRQMIAILLSRRNITCTLVEDGKKAVEAWESGGHELILMDVQMPYVDGLEATRIIREKEKERGSGEHITIIAMTAHAMDKDRDNCLKAGMDDYISKPIEFNELMSLINSYAGSRPEVTA